MADYATVPTRDNPSLSRPTSRAAKFDINCKSDIPDIVAGYVANARTPGTARAYRSDIDHFEEWGGTIPSTPITVATYLAEHATLLRFATLRRRLVAIAAAHNALDLVNPVQSDLVRTTLVGIARRHGTAQRQAEPLLQSHLVKILTCMDGSFRSFRDAALLLIGFHGAFRRSELVAIQCRDLAWIDEGVIVRLARSKVDQIGAGREIGIGAVTSDWCPVRALRDWLVFAKISEGPVFRGIDGGNGISPHALSGEAVSLIVKRWAALAGLPPAAWSGHSLRAGFVTTAAMAGIPTWKIRRQTGHASDVTLGRYIRTGERFPFDLSAPSDRLRFEAPVRSIPIRRTYCVVGSGAA